MSKKVISKGYTLEVTSWENDGDNYNTKKVTVDSKDEAQKLYRICKELFNSSKSGVGNSMGGEKTQTLIDFAEKNANLFPDLVDSSNSSELSDYVSDDEILDYFREISYNLMGGSEFYDFRVCQSCIVTYSPEDVYLEQVTF